MRKVQGIGPTPGHPRIEGSDKRRLFAVLHHGPVTSPVEVVRAAIRGGKQRKKMSREMTFEATTRAEANRLADEWWMTKKGARLIHRSQIAVGSSPAWIEAERWAVTIHYEPENSN